MRTKERNRILQAAEKAFLKAMCDGYAGGKKPRIVRGVCTLPVTVGPFQVIDEWRLPLRGTTLSSGRTMIKHTELGVIWEMHYFGSYPKKAIAFLKLALTKNYKAGVFRGGRGPEEFRAPRGPYFYRSFIVGDFVRFHGCETVSDLVHIGPLKSSAQIGSHHFIGGALI